jgi:transposase
MKVTKYTASSAVKDGNMVSDLEPDLMQVLMSELPNLKRCAACATVPVERLRWQVLVLIASGRSRQEISAATGYSLRTIRQIVQRYRDFGATGLRDGRKLRITPALLSAPQLQALREALQHPPLDGGAWTGPKVAHWMATATGQQVHRQRGWEYWRRLRSELHDTGELFPAQTGEADGSMRYSVSDP